MLNFQISLILLLFVALIQEHEKKKLKVAEIQRDAQEDAQKRNLTLDDLTQGLINYKHLGLDFEKADDGKIRYGIVVLRI